MTFVRPRARILETSTTTGNGPYALAGAVDNSYNTFASFMAVGDVTHATVVEPGVAFWAGLVTYSAANQITLTDVEETKGTFGSGTKEIFPGRLASTAAYPEDVSGCHRHGWDVGGLYHQQFPRLRHAGASRRQYRCLHAARDKRRTKSIGRDRQQ